MHTRIGAPGEAAGGEIIIQPPADIGGGEAGDWIGFAGRDARVVEGIVGSTVKNQLCSSEGYLIDYGF